MRYVEIGCIVIMMMIVGMVLVAGLSSCGTKYDTHKNDQKYWSELAGAVN